MKVESPGGELYSKVSKNKEKLTNEKKTIIFYNQVIKTKLSSIKHVLNGQ